MQLRAQIEDDPSHLKHLLTESRDGPPLRSLNHICHRRFRWERHFCPPRSDTLADARNANTRGESGTGGVDVPRPAASVMPEPVYRPGPISQRSASDTTEAAHEKRTKTRCA